ncbi:30S ribosomal protein S8 [Candidatus Berkelbacteria bacterium]|nr:30S ribosomal protein S8 [Candidatus Berkelbacteria bacterium]
MDPIADMLTRIRNAALGHQIEINLPHSRLKETIAQLLIKHGFLSSAQTSEIENKKTLTLKLKYRGDLSAIRVIRRISKPGLRIYVKSNQIPRPKGGFGLVIISTPSGLMTGDQARRQHLGGEVLCEVLS